KHFSWLALVLLFLGMLSLSAVAAAPFLPGPSHNSPSLAPPGGINPEFQLYIVAAPLVVALVAGLGLLLGLIGRRFTFLNAALLYISLLGSAVLFLWGLHTYHRDLGPKGY